MKGCSIIVLFFLLGITFGCGSTKSVVVPETTVVKNISDSRLLKSIQESYVPFQRLYVKKFSADYTINQSRKSFSGSLYLNKDKELVVSVAPLLGIELFRAKITTDSLFFLDRTKRTLNLSAVEKLREYFYIEADFHALQSLLINQLFVLDAEGDLQEEIRKFKHSLGKNSYFFNSYKKGKNVSFRRKLNIFHSFEVIPGTFNIGGVSLKILENDLSVKVIYSDFKEFDGKFLPARIQFIGTKGKDKFEANIHFQHIDLDGSNEIFFQKPDKYRILLMN